jgi:hypothetical protein
MKKAARRFTNAASGGFPMTNPRDDDPIAAALRNAPIDNEPETEEEKQSVAEARAWLERNSGKGIPHEEAMRRLAPGTPRPQSARSLPLSQPLVRLWEPRLTFGYFR